MERIEYGNLKLCEHNLGLDAEKLSTLGADGTVRTKKMCNTCQSQRLYSKDDIRSWLTDTPSE